MNVIGDWLARIGLQQYAEIFESNEVDLRALTELGEDDFEKLGVALDDRRRLVRAIEGLRFEPLLIEQRQAIPTPRRLRPDAERRQITAFYCDLVDSTALSASMDPEDLHDLIWEYRDACQNTVGHYGGFVRGYEGDGIMVYFGYPRAFEDDAERAVRAGVELIDALKALHAKPTLPEGMAIRVRIGIATGEVVAGALHVEQGLVARDAAIGMAPNLAARLQTIATPDTLVICPATQALVKGQFDYRDLGVHALKGLGEPVRVSQVLGIRTSVSRFEAASEGRLAVFVDRHEELDLLFRQWAKVIRGEGRVICISGEPGIGKSRLTGEFLSRVEAEPYHRVRFQFSPYHRDNAFYPIIRYLERTAGFESGDSDEQKVEKLEILLEPFRDDSALFIPLVASLMSVPTGNRYPPLRLTSQQQKAQIMRLLAQQLVALSSQAPVVVLAEDLHWSDASSREFLDLVVESIAEVRVLVLATYRQELRTPWLDRSHVSVLAVNRLSGANIRTMVQSVAAGKAFPEPILGQIVDRTDGVPLFVEELTSAVLESGILEEHEGRYELTRKTPSFAIPSTLKDSLEARLDQLGSAKEIAQIGAAIGREFSRDLLATVAGREQSEIDDALEKLTRANLVYRRSASHPPRYIFKHGLVQEAAYESLLKSRRQELHARIALVAEERFRADVDAQPHLLAHHYIHAEQPQPAVEYLLEAGRRALERSAFTETIGHMSRSLDLLPGIEDARVRDRRELEVLIMLGAAHRIVSGFSSAVVEDCFERARILCDRVGTPAERVAVLRGLWMCHFTRGRLAVARGLAEQTISVARESSERGALMLGHWMLGIISFWQGEFSRARRELEAALELYEMAEQQGQLLSAQLDPGVASMAYLAWDLAILGYPDEALERSSEAVQNARNQGDPFTLTFAIVFAGCVHLTLDSGDDISELLDEAQALADNHGFAHWKAVLKVLGGQQAIAKGQPGTGLAMVEDGCGLLRDEGSTVNLPWSISIAARAYAAANEPDQALMCLGEATTLARETGEHHWLAELHRIKGEALLASSDDNSVAAQSCVRQALDIARGQEAKLLELRAAITLARMTSGTERATDARRDLEFVYGWFSEGPEIEDMRIAAEVLEAGG